MEKKIQFSIDPDEKKIFHEDLKMKIPSLKREFIFDTYYLTLGFTIENVKHLTSVISNYLEKCKNSILNLSNGEIIYLPIDFSDQYYGAFRVMRLDKDVFSFDLGTIEKTEKVAYDGFTQLQLEGAEFDIDFQLTLTEIDVIESFQLSSLNQSQGWK